MGKNTFVLTVAGQTREATIEVIIPTVLKAYFATLTVEKEIAAHEETYEIVQGDYLSAIASKKGTTVEKLKADNGLTTNDIFVGDTLLIKTEKESDKGKACFERIKNTSVGGEAYIVIETENLEGKTIRVNIKQGLEDVLAKANENIFFQHDNGSSDLAEVCVGNYADKDEYINKEDLKNLAIIKVKLEPKNKENKKKWEDGLACAANNNAKLYLLIDAHSGNDKKGEHISYKGYKGNDDDCKISNYFLNEEDEWFEVGNIIIKEIGIYHTGHIDKVELGSAMKVKYVYYDINNKKYDIGEMSIFKVKSWLKKNYQSESDCFLGKMEDLLGFEVENIKFKYKFSTTKRRYINPECMAGLIGAMIDVGYKDFTITGFSNKDGSPGISKSHLNGVAGDLLYLNTGFINKITYLEDFNFDYDRMIKFVNALHKFGWGITKSMLSENFNRIVEEKEITNPKTKEKEILKITEVTLLPHTIHYKKKLKNGEWVRHHHHIHLNGFKPNYK